MYDSQVVTGSGADVSTEGAILALMQLIARAEGRIFDQGKIGGDAVTRQWILDTYRECRQVVCGGNPVHLLIDEASERVKAA